MIQKIVRHVTLVGLLAAIGCVAGRVGSAGAGAGQDWGTTLAQAEVAARDHRYADADRMLADYASRYPSTEGANEASYWRGVIALEPTNHDATPEVAAALFDSYMRSNGPLPHRLEAEILRHLALRLQSTSSMTVAASSSATAAGSGATAAPDRSADLKAKDTEIQRLRDELAKANDELERIKRRLTAPTKP